MYVANFAMIELMVVALFILTLWAWGPNYSDRKKHAQCANRIVPIGTASANSVESDLGCTSKIFFDNVPTNKMELFRT